MFNRVRLCREGVELTQEELADALGVTRQTIISIEAGKWNPSLELAFRTARFFQRHIEEIFSDDGTYPHLIAISQLSESDGGQHRDGQADVPDGSLSAPAAQETS